MYCALDLSDIKIKAYHIAQALCHTHSEKLARIVFHTADEETLKLVPIYARLLSCRSSTSEDERAQELVDAGRLMEPVNPQLVEAMFSHYFPIGNIDIIRRYFLRTPSVKDVSFPDRMLLDARLEKNPLVRAEMMISAAHHLQEHDLVLVAGQFKANFPIGKIDVIRKTLFSAASLRVDKYLGV